MNNSPELAIQGLLLIGPTGEAVDRFIQEHDFPIREAPTPPSCIGGRPAPFCLATGCSGPLRRGRWSGSRV